MENTDKIQDRILGCLIGGAAGDALGYPVEFLGELEIFENYGKSGITEYKTDNGTGKAFISDDTQMSLFTADGVLTWNRVNARLDEQENSKIKPRHCIARSYIGWLITQDTSYSRFSEAHAGSRKKIPWLLTIPELFSQRSPGNTCLSALRQRKTRGTDIPSYIDDPLNESKGCGGIMRVAPVALKNSDMTSEALDVEAAEIAAITHGHSLGYMPAAVLAHIIHGIVYGDNSQDLRNIIIDAISTVTELFSEDPHLSELVDIVYKSIFLADNDRSDLDNIHNIGEGWVAEETLGIAIYCALRHQDSFSDGIIAAVNHKGDSDSTGAVTGNILGTWLGADKIDEKWKENLELANTITRMARYIGGEDTIEDEPDAHTSGCLSKLKSALVNLMARKKKN